ncbi:MAG: hypothetical protein AABW89_02620 [Nanoarchaeota archaeon]
MGFVEDNQVMAGGLEDLYLTRPDVESMGLVFFGNFTGPIVDSRQQGAIETARKIIPVVASRIGLNSEFIGELYVVNLRYNPVEGNRLFCSGDVYRLQNCRRS